LAMSPQTFVEATMVIPVNGSAVGSGSGWVGAHPASTSTAAVTIARLLIFIGPV
jgi:hypothetical protein